MRWHRLLRPLALASLLIVGGCSGDESDGADAGTTEVCEEPCGKECCWAGKKCDTRLMRCVTVCVPECSNRECGSDLCGGSCGTCPEGMGCVQGRCSDCIPDCRFKQCGPDGCGGECGICPGSSQCQEDGWCSGCIPNCTNKNCGSDGCGGSCGHCPVPLTCGGGGVPGVCGR